MNLKKLAAVLAAASVLSIGSIAPVYAENDEATTEAVTEEVTLKSEDGLWEYTLLENNEISEEEYVRLDSYFGNETDLSIPSEIDGVPVKELGDYTFYENKILSKVTIPATLTDFGDFSFFGCTSIEEYIVDEGNEIYKTIDGAVIGVDNMLYVCYPPAKTDTEYTLPDGVVAINPAAFAVCKNLKKINFPDTLESIGYYCFSECTSLNNIVIPEKVTELNKFVFTGCTALTDINLPDTMYTIDAGAFSFCSSLESIDFPKYIQEIGQGAFTATAMTEIEIPSTVQNIGYYAFGYTADQQGQFVEMDNFVIKGVEGSVAQTYCSENAHVTFEAVEVATEANDEAEKETEAAAKDNEKSEGLKPGVIVAICVAGVAVVAVIVIIVVKLVRGKKTGNDDDEVEEENDIEDDNSDDNDE